MDGSYRKHKCLDVACQKKEGDSISVMWCLQGCDGVVWGFSSVKWARSYPGADESYHIVHMSQYTSEAIP
jgi:hypothetical protein